MLDGLRALDRAGGQPKIETRESDPGDHGELLPIEATLQHRRPSSRAPGARATTSFSVLDLRTEIDTCAMTPAT
jgi:hypothetical protein